MLLFLWKRLLTGFYTFFRLNYVWGTLSQLLKDFHLFFSVFGCFHSLFFFLYFFSLHFHHSLLFLDLTLLNWQLVEAELHAQVHYRRLLIIKVSFIVVLLQLWRRRLKLNVDVLHSLLILYWAVLSKRKLLLIHLMTVHVINSVVDNLPLWVWESVRRVQKRTKDGRRSPSFLKCLPFVLSLNKLIVAETISIAGLALECFLEEPLSLHVGSGWIYYDVSALKQRRTVLMLCLAVNGRNQRQRVFKFVGWRATPVEIRVFCVPLSTWPRAIFVELHLTWALLEVVWRN